MRHRTPWAPLFALAFFSAACGDDSSSSDGTTGGSGGEGGADDGACALSLAEADGEAPEGGRLELAFSTGAEVTGLTLSGQGVAWTELGEDTARVRLAYGQPTASVTLAGECGGEPVSHTADIQVRQITWQQLPAWQPGTTGPLGREYGTMWMSPTEPDALHVWGGFHYVPQQFTPSTDFWTLDLTTDTWTEVPTTGAPLTPGGGLALDGNSAPFYFGGLDDEAANQTAPTLFRLDQQAGNVNFVEVNATTPTVSGDYQPGFVWDAPRERFVSACGINTSWGYHCRVRAFYPGEGRWETLEPAGDAPEGRNGHFYAMDEENERMIVFSGDMGSGSWACDCAQDTWALELSEMPARWVRLSEGGAIPGRRNGAFVIDPVGHRMFVWGGTPDGAVTAEGIYALDLERGHEEWTLVEVQGAPPARSSGRAVYDTARSRLLMGFGNGDTGVQEDLWALNL